MQREEAGRQSAVAAKATKKTRKRATKAAASRNAAQLTATNDAGRSAAPALVNSSLHAASCADGSGVCEAEQPRAKTAEITRGGLPGARQTGVPQWVMCPISQVLVYSRPFVSDHYMCKSSLCMMLQHLGLICIQKAVCR